MGDVDNPFQQLEAAKKQLIMEFKENAKSAQELEFWNRMEIVRDDYPNSQEDSSSGDTTDEEQVDGENLNKGKKTDEKIPDTASDEETKEQKSASGERADKEKSFKEHKVTFQIPEMEHGAGDDTPLPQKDFIFQNDGMEHDFNHNATRDESLINLFENKDSNGLGALQKRITKKVSAEKANSCKVGMKDLFKTAKKIAKMEAKASEKKRKLKEIESKKKRKIEARETERKRKLEENESKKKMIIEAQETKEKKHEKKRKLRRKESWKKRKLRTRRNMKNVYLREKNTTQKQRWKEETKSSQEKHISEAQQSKQKKKIDQNESKERRT
ncbi:unnamed protein product [Mytilus edulis]|uniref:Uncharacterized protein n=1 Tax=Mytilus edulis TaxID=6550 RepID=A0A8S3V6C3_MYTED|nr:unnamed protein product [Mytilus edulis]